jgi:hypothetical protein
MLAVFSGNRSHNNKGKLFMTDTAQPELAADPNVALQDAADAFRNFDKPVKARDEAGKFASTQEPDDELDEPEIQPDDLEGDEPEDDDGEIDEGEVEADEASDEDQPEAVDMPTSWNKEQAEHWNALPPTTQAYIAEREGQRDQAVNQKFQEAANLKTANQAVIDEANANRDLFIQAADEVLGAVMPQKPSPQAYGAGTGNYDRESYDLAMAQYEQSTEYLQQVKQQRDHQAAQRSQQEDQQFMEAKSQLEQTHAPKLLSLIPDLSDPTKGQAALNGLIDYAVSNGIMEEQFAPENQKYITSPELAMIWKAKEYDRITAKKGAPPPQAKAGPAVKPGVTSPRSAVRKSAFQKQTQRLAKTGSIEDGAAIFKHFLK